MRASALLLATALIACDGGNPATDVPGTDAPPTDLAPDPGPGVPCALTLAVVDDFGTPAAGRPEVDLRVPYAGTRDLVVRCTKDGDLLEGVPVRFTLEEGSGRLALDRGLANTAAGGLARVIASWPAGSPCGLPFVDDVRACLEEAPAVCVTFHLSTGKGPEAPMLSVTAEPPESGTAPVNVVATFFERVGDTFPTCATLKPYALPMAAVSSPPFAPGATYKFQSLPGSDAADFQVWTVAARGTTAGGSLVAWACVDEVRTSRCDQSVLRMDLGPVPVR